MTRMIDEVFNLKETLSFGKLIKEKRKEMDMNQTEFGELMDVNQGTVSMWELGITSPPIDSAEYILKVLGFELIVREKQSE